MFVTLRAGAGTAAPRQARTELLDKMTNSLLPTMKGEKEIAKCKGRSEYKSLKLNLGSVGKVKPRSAATFEPTLKLWCIKQNHLLLLTICMISVIQNYHVHLSNLEENLNFLIQLQ